MRTARPEPSGFAAKAKDLQALRDAVDQAATVSGALWLSYLFVFFYLAIAAGAVTHKDLFFENPVKLPFLGVGSATDMVFLSGPTAVSDRPLVHAAALRDAGRQGRRVPCRTGKLKSGTAKRAHDCVANCRATSLCNSWPGRAMSGPAFSV